jgi:methylmalonyl-CoA epimerase
MSGVCLLVMMSVGFVRDFRYPPFEDLSHEFTKRLEQTPPGTSVALPINPTGWDMRIVKHWDGMIADVSVEARADGFQVVQMMEKLRGGDVRALARAISVVEDGAPLTSELRSDGQRVEVRLDHVAVAVRSIAAARGFYEALGLVVTHEETVEHEHVKTAMLPLGESRIELLEATQEDSTIGRFLAKRGEGLHHVAVHVEGIDAMFARLMTQGVRLASDAVRVGAGGHRYFFVHPASTGGVLLEIVGDGVVEGGEWCGFCLSTLLAVRVASRWLMGIWREEL